MEVICLLSSAKVIYGDVNRSCLKFNHLHLKLSLPLSNGINWASSLIISCLGSHNCKMTVCTGLTSASASSLLLFIPPFFPSFLLSSLSFLPVSLPLSVCLPVCLSICLSFFLTFSIWHWQEVPLCFTLIVLPERFLSFGVLTIPEDHGPSPHSCTSGGCFCLHESLTQWCQQWSPSHRTNTLRALDYTWVILPF